MAADDRPASPPTDAVFPLGAHLTAAGARFAVASDTAEGVELCLIDLDPAGGPPSERRIGLAERTFGVWHAQVNGIGPGQHYGYRVHGRYDPASGLRTNPAKLLVDPYATRIAGRVGELAATLGYVDDPMHGPPSTVDSLGNVPLSVLTSAAPAADPATLPRVPWADTVIYELHVKGYTHCHPEVPLAQRGSYLGLAHPSVIEYLTGLGVTAVELLPVHATSDEPSLVRRGARNYWGYSTLGFFAPHAGYGSAAGNELTEFRAMLAALHAAGIEVIMDVVYNHTCEGDVGGPTLSFRGLDAPGYYAHRGGEQLDVTGCGNTLDAGSPTVARMVCDSLRYWAALGVDGFRFDLASVLGRPGAGPFDQRAALLMMIASDPLLATRKLIAEPWDATGDGYRVGGFGVQWAEWNDRYRDNVRDFWRGCAGINDLARRLSGSEELYARSGRRPWSSINFITAHDGFTLRDLVSYQDKHNDGNGENNCDGTDNNRSCNFGVEGETDDPEIRATRLNAAKAMLSTLILSSGTPMITAGDERWRTQGGNNNAYNQDNEVSWLDWAPGREAEAFTALTARLIALRRTKQAPPWDRFYRPADVTWWLPDGRQVTDRDWTDGGVRTIGMLSGSNWLLVLHGGTEPVRFVLPPLLLTPALDSASRDGTPADPAPLPPGGTVELAPLSVLLLLGG
jgi:glycogen operon protein